MAEPSDPAIISNIIMNMYMLCTLASYIYILRMLCMIASYIYVLIFTSTLYTVIMSLPRFATASLVSHQFDTSDGRYHRAFEPKPFG